MVIKSLAKYPATAECKEKTSKAEVLLRRGLEPPTFRFTKQDLTPYSLTITPQMRAVPCKQLAFINTDV